MKSVDSSWGELKQKWIDQHVKYRNRRKRKEKSFGSQRKMAENILGAAGVI